jgi:hypothetical protein
LSARAIDIDVKSGAVDRLLNTRVYQAWNMAKVAEQGFGISKIVAEAGSADLQVERRGLAKVQNLADDIGGQK